MAYKVIFIISFICTVILMISSIVIFIKFKIVTAYEDVTGKTAQKEIMRIKNEKEHVRKKYIPKGMGNNIDSNLSFKDKEKNKDLDTEAPTSESETEVLNKTTGIMFQTEVINCEEEPRTEDCETEIIEEIERDINFNILQDVLIVNTTEIIEEVLVL